jgi:hypothetical protein
VKLLKLMLTLEVTAAEQHNRFIKRVIESDLVWALTTTTGEWVFSDSNEKDEEDRGVFPVWSDKAYAQRCAVKEWASYTAESIPLSEFLEAWCAGLYNNQELVGTNWDGELHGMEIEPLALVLQVMDALKTANKTLELKTYATMEEFVEQVRRVVG